MGLLSFLFKPKKDSVFGSNAPNPLNDETYVNGQLMTSRIFDPLSKSYKNQINFSPEQQNIVKKATENYQSTLNDLSNFYEASRTENGLNQSISKFYEPLKNSIMSTYNSVLGRSVNDANRLGLGDSIGFENYRAKELDKNLSQDLSSAYQDSVSQVSDLSQKRLQQLASGLGLFNQAISSPYQLGQSLLDDNLNGTAASNQFSINRFNSAENAAEKRRFKIPGLSFLF
jgi:hypothetical protein